MRFCHCSSEKTLRCACIGTCAVNRTNTVMFYLSNVYKWKSLFRLRRSLSHDFLLWKIVCHISSGHIVIQPHHDRTNIARGCNEGAFSLRSCFSICRKLCCCFFLFFCKCNLDFSLVSLIFQKRYQDGVSNFEGEIVISVVHT